MSGACLVLAALTALPAFSQAASQKNGQPGAASAAQPVNESEMLIADAPGGGEAAGGETAAPGARAASAVSTWDFVRMLLVLALVVAAIYVLLWLLRRRTGRRVQENDLIRVLGSRTLAGTRSLHLVEVGTRVYLVGSADGGVDLISEITDPESRDSLRLTAAEETPSGRRTFQSVLSEIFRPAKGQATMGDSLGFLKRQRDRLRKL